MGLFYTNMTLFRAERTAAVVELRRLKRSAFVSPSFDGHTVVFDEAIEEQSTEAIDELGQRITQALSCVAMTAVLHDDDVLYLWLFENGKVRDHYNSCPAYFDDSLSPEPSGGDTKLICQAFGRQDRTGNRRCYCEWTCSRRNRKRRLLLARLFCDRRRVYSQRIQGN